MNELQGKRIAVIATDGFEESELVEIISEKREPIQGFKHHDKAGKVNVDATFDDVFND